MKKIKIAVVGAGYIGQVHIEALKNNLNCELIAIIDSSENAKKIAQNEKVLFFDNLESFLKNAKKLNCSGIILATPNHLHVSQSLACINVGLTVLVEKPLASNLKEAELLVKEVEKTKAKVLVGHHRSHSLIIKKAQEIINSDYLGKLVAINGTALFFKPKSYFEIPWKTKLRSGGPILINLIHEINSLRMLCGEIEEVFSFSSNKTRNLEVEDTVSISLRFRNGVLGSFLLSDCSVSSKSWEQTSKENSDYAYYNEDCYLITGTKGSLAIPTMKIKTYKNEEEKSWFKSFHEEQFYIKNQDPIEIQLEHFIKVIRNEEKPKVTVFDGFKNLQVIEAILKSSETKRVIEIKN